MRDNWTCTEAAGDLAHAVQRQAAWAKSPPAFDSFLLGVGRFCPPYKLIDVTERASFLKREILDVGDVEQIVFPALDPRADEVLQDAEVERKDWQASARRKDRARMSG
jgi:hypothetical protein